MYGFDQEWARVRPRLLAAQPETRRARRRRRRRELAMFALALALGVVLARVLVAWGVAS